MYPQILDQVHDILDFEQTDYKPGDEYFLVVPEGPRKGDIVRSTKSKTIADELQALYGYVIQH